MGTPKKRFADFGPAEATSLLISAALASLLIYAFLIVQPTSLLVYYHDPRLDLLDLLKEGTQDQVRLIVAFVLLAILYSLGWLAADRLGRSAILDSTRPAGRRAGRHNPGLGVDGPRRASAPSGGSESMRNWAGSTFAPRGLRLAAASRGLPWLVVIGGALAAGTILLYLYPFDATDLFDYISRGRIQGVYGANPYREVALDFPQDPFYTYAGWRDYPSPYGPAWELLAGAAAYFAGDGILANILTFKILVGIFFLISVLLAASILLREAPERALSGVWLLAWNPLILYEAFGHGHNDMVMAAWILGAVWFLTRQRYTLAVTSLVGGALVKFIPLLLIPAAGVIALRDLPNPPARLRYMAVTLLACLGLTVLMYSPYWYGPETLTVQRQAQLFTTSLPTLIYHQLEERLGALPAGLLVSQSGFLLTGLYALWQARRAECDRSWLSFPRASLHILLFYLLVAVLWFQQWYFVWPVVLAALLPASPVRSLAIFCGFAVLSKPFLLAPLVFLWSGEQTTELLELRLTIGVLAIPWMAALWVIWKHSIREFRQSREQRVESGE